MAKHDLYDSYFEPATAMLAEGARIGVATCKVCGAAILLEPRDTVNRPKQHIDWHNRYESELVILPAPPEPEQEG